MREFGDWCRYSGIISELGSWMWCSNSADLGIPIRPRSDGIVNNRRPRGEVAVLEASNKCANPAKNEQYQIEKIEYNVGEM